MKKFIDDGGSAFPCEGGDMSGLISNPGMSLRDWFAGQALPIAAKAEHEWPCGADHEPTYSGIADRCYLMADTMLKAREAKQ